MSISMIFKKSCFTFIRNYWDSKNLKIIPKVWEQKVRFSNMFYPEAQNLTTFHLKKQKMDKNPIWKILLTLNHYSNFQRNKLK